jgi:hypothetical protein
MPTRIISLPAAKTLLPMLNDPETAAEAATVDAFRKSRLVVPDVLSVFFEFAMPPP